MRPILYVLILPVFLLLGNSERARKQCDPETLIQECKQDLPPYSYSSSRTFMSKKGVSREISVNLLKGEEYRFVFNVKGLPKDAVIEVHDGAEGKNRKLLMSSKNIPSERERFIYEPKKGDGSELFISYEIPQTTDMVCFSFVVGYRLTFVED